MQLLYRCLKTTAARFSVGHKMFLFILLTTAIQIHSANGQRSCYKCEGINCLRTTYNQVETCSNGLDICATIFDGQTIQAQGCLENLAEDLRRRCNADDGDNLAQCHKCNDNLCNNMAAPSFECVQCDSKKDINCYDNAHLFQPMRCPISRTPNQYCYAKKDGDWVVRGCTSTLVEQRSCMASEECIICEPSEISSCNIQKATDDDSATTPSTPPPPTKGTTSTPKPAESGSVLLSSFSVINYIVIFVHCILKFN